jgi:translocator protein
MYRRKGHLWREGQPTRLLISRCGNAAEQVSKNLHQGLCISIGIVNHIVMESQISDHRSGQNAILPKPATMADRARVRANIVCAVAQVVASQVTAQMGVSDIGTRSAQSPSLFTPPDFTFGIWGLIFLGMTAYAIYQALPGNLASSRLRRVGWWTAAAMALNAAWELVTVEYGITIITVVLIFAMLTTLMRTFQALYSNAPQSRRETAFIVFPVSIFAAWITVAAIANTASWLGNAGGFDGGSLSDAAWVGVLAVVGGAVGALAIWRNRANIFYAIVLLWAFGGIIYKGIRLDEPLVTGGASLALLIVGATYLIFGRKSSRDNIGV